MGPGLTAFTRIPREINSPDRVRVSERRAAFVAPYTLVFGIPMCAFTDLFSTMDAGFAKIGNSACIRKYGPFTLVEKE